MEDVNAGDVCVNGSKDRRQPGINAPMVTSGADSDATTAGRTLLSVIAGMETEPLPGVNVPGVCPR